MLENIPTDNQVVLIKALGARGDDAALPVLCARLKEGNKVIRLTIIKALAELGSARAVPALKELLNDVSDDIKQAAKDALATLPGVDGE